MAGLAEPILRLVEAFGRLPGIGPKSAQRLAFHVVGMKTEQVDELVDALRRAKRDLAACAQCCLISDSSPCEICADGERDRSMVCVVQDTRDVYAFERMGSYRGLYHVLGGVISPLDGVGPDDIHLRELLMRLNDDTVTELILATSSTIEGETTALYVARLTSGVDRLKVTRIAHGLPVGGDIEYADEMTLARALEFRRPI